MNHYKIQSQKNIRKIIFSLIIVFIISYGIFNARYIISGPNIHILSPNTNTEIKSDTMTIRGVAKNTTYISINQRPIYINTEGFFEEEVLLYPGFNNIEIRAIDRFKQEEKEIIKIYSKYVPTPS